MKLEPINKSAFDRVDDYLKTVYEALQKLDLKLVTDKNEKERLRKLGIKEEDSYLVELTDEQKKELKKAGFPVQRTFGVSKKLWRLI